MDIFSWLTIKLLIVDIFLQDSFKSVFSHFNTAMMHKAMSITESPPTYTNKLCKWLVITMKDNKL